MKTVYLRILKAAKRGKGVHLSADEVSMLSRDTAISARGEMDEYDEEPITQADEKEYIDRLGKEMDKKCKSM